MGRVMKNTTISHEEKARWETGVVTRHFEAVQHRAAVTASELFRCSAPTEAQVRELARAQRALALANGETVLDALFTVREVIADTYGERGLGEGKHARKARKLLRSGQVKPGQEVRA